MSPAAGTGLDPDHTLPVLADAFIIDFRHRGGDRERCGRRVRPQAQIGAEDIAVFRDVIEDPDDIPSDPLGRFARRPFAPIKHFRIVENTEIDIAGIVELECAHLAERDGEYPIPRQAIVIERDLERCIHALAGQFGQHERHVHHIKRAGQVFPCKRQVRGLFGAAQGPHHLLHRAPSQLRQHTHGFDGFAPIAVFQFPPRKTPEIRRPLTSECQCVFRCLRNRSYVQHALCPWQSQRGFEAGRLCRAIPIGQDKLPAMHLRHGHNQRQAKAAARLGAR